MSISYLSLGSNLSDREEYITKAKELIELKAGKILKSSSVYETEPWGHFNEQFRIQKHFLNQVISIETELSPISLINCLLEIELSLGRIRNISRTPTSRTIDIDILFYDNLIINQPELAIPHPLLHERRFTLLPLSEIAPKLIHPVHKKTMNVLLRDCKDNSEVKLF